MKNIGAVIGAAVAGLFVGAAAATAVQRQPELLKNVREGSKKMLGSFAEAFKEGYYTEGKNKLGSGAGDSGGSRG